MSKEVSYGRPIIKMPDGFVSVTVNHKDLDGLIGRLMQMCELTGDVEQRRALKDEIKLRSREWLDSLYKTSGYGSIDGVTPSAEVLEYQPK